MRPVRVLLVDDHALFRRGLERVLADERDLEVVGEALDGVEGVDLAVELMPDVVVMDLRMPRLGGIEATRAITEKLPHVRVLVLTVSDHEDDLFDALRAGASGYLLKEVAVAEVGAAVRSVAAGHSLVSPSLTAKLVARFRVLEDQAGDRHRAARPRLTARELEVLRLVARGQSNREIGRSLFIAENTVKNHVRNVLEKLDLHSRTEAVVYAMREQLLEPDQGSGG